MPWREMSPMQQRLEFVREYETELFTMTELAAQYGISRKTGYKWLAQVRGRRARWGCAIVPAGRSTAHRRRTPTWSTR